MNKMKYFGIDYCNGQVLVFLCIRQAKMTVSTPMAPTMGTMMRATEPLGIKTKVERSTIATIMPQAPAFCATVIPPRRR